MAQWLSTPGFNSLELKKIYSEEQKQPLQVSKGKNTVQGIQLQHVRVSFGSLNRYPGRTSDGATILLGVEVPRRCDERSGKFPLADVLVGQTLKSQVIREMVISDHSMFFKKARQSEQGKEEGRGCFRPSVVSLNK